MAGLVPAIHVSLIGTSKKEDVDARHKAGHDKLGGDNFPEKTYPRAQIRTYLERTLLAEGRTHEAS
jgi:hypothetical protein